MLKRIALICLLLVLACTFAAAEEEDEEWSLVEDVLLTDDGEEIPLEEEEPAAPADDGEYTARDDFIDRIVALGQELYEKAGGRSQRAHYSGDIYVCKNFTVYLFR